MLPQYTFKPFPPWKLDYVNHVILRDMNKNMGILPPQHATQHAYILC